MIVLGLVVLSHLIARWFAASAVRDLEALNADMKRATNALAKGRHRHRFLEPRLEPAEVARLRESARIMQSVLVTRHSADRVVLGASVHDLKAGLAGLAHLLDATAGPSRPNGASDAGSGSSFASK